MEKDLTMEKDLKPADVKEYFSVKDGGKILIEVKNDMPLPDNWGAALFWNAKAFDVVMKALKMAYVNKLITNEEGRWADCIKELILQFETWKEEYTLSKEAESSGLAKLDKKK